MDEAQPAGAILLSPIAHVRSARRDARDDDWESVTAEIELAPGFAAEALDGIEEFSHLEVLFHFHLVPDARIERVARRPRDDARFPRVGIFAQRGSARPNRLGATIVELRARAGRVLHVHGLDALDGTPVLDLKPVMVEFLPRAEVRQPAWTRELMQNYWRARG